MMQNEIKEKKNDSRLVFFWQLNNLLWFSFALVVKTTAKKNSVNIDESYIFDDSMIRNSSMIKLKRKLRKTKINFDWKIHHQITCSFERIYFLLNLQKNS